MNNNTLVTSRPQGGRGTKVTTLGKLEGASRVDKNKQEYFGNFEGARRAKTKVATL